MWSGPSIQATLNATAATHGKTADLLTRRISDPVAAWRSFDQQAEQQGGNYYGGLNPSTARNTTYNEYYAETWAVLNTRQGHVLYQNIDWDRVQSPDIEIVRRASGSFQLVGHAVPMDLGPHAGKRVDFSADFDRNFRIVGDTSQMPLPGSSRSQGPVMEANDVQQGTARHEEKNSPGQDIGPDRLGEIPPTAPPFRQQAQDQMERQDVPHSILPERVRQLLGDSRAHVQRLADKHGLSWDQGMENTVYAVARKAGEAGMVRVTHLAVDAGQIRLAEYDGLTLKETGLDAKQAANTPVATSVQELADVSPQPASTRAAFGEAYAR